MTFSIVNFTVQRNEIILASNIDVSLDQGQILGVTGPNGSGKSTLLAQLVGALPIMHGQVHIDGRLPSYVLIEQTWTTAFGYLVADVLEWSSDSPLKRREAIEVTGIAYLLTRDVRTLSGGERARVGFARAIASSADVMLLDEPTAHLDQASTEEVQGWLAHIKDTRRYAVIVTHDPKVLVTCDLTVTFK